MFDMKLVNILEKNVKQSLYRKSTKILPRKMCEGKTIVCLLSYIYVLYKLIIFKNKWKKTGVRNLLHLAQYKQPVMNSLKLIRPVKTA